MDRQRFFNEIRPLFGKLSSRQVQGMSAVLEEWTRLKYTDLRWLAYMFATIYHETAKTMWPIEEYGKGKGYKYGKKLKRSGVPYTLPDKIYSGKGFVQLTWYENYQLMGRLLGIDLLNHPELALDLKIATDILFEGMLRASSSFGDFTGKCLEMYFNETVLPGSKEEENGWINARKIINGLDRAELIAGYAKQFHGALVA